MPTEMHVMVATPHFVKMNTETKQITLDESAVSGDTLSYSNSGSW